jgi:hypothetical protein
LRLRDSDFIIQPQEVMADSFALLMEWRANGVLPAVGCWSRSANTAGGA